MRLDIRQTIAALSLNGLMKTLDILNHLSRKRKDNRLIEVYIFVKKLLVQYLNAVFKIIKSGKLQLKILDLIFKFFKLACIF
jgi:hypothetical protein